MERRKNRRVVFKVTATVKTEQSVIEGTVENLSMKGMFFVCSGDVASDRQVEITITLSGSSSRLSLKLKGKAVRQTNAGFGIEFQEMDLDSFIHLRCIIEENSGDPDGVFEDFYKSISLNE